MPDPTDILSVDLSERTCFYTVPAVFTVATDSFLWTSNLFRRFLPCFFVPVREARTRRASIFSSGAYNQRGSSFRETSSAGHGRDERGARARAAQAVRACAAQGGLHHTREARQALWAVVRRRGRRPRRRAHLLQARLSAPRHQALARPALDGARGPQRRRRRLPCVSDVSRSCAF